ncbi:MAG: corrinoid protein [Thermogutta sp.]
MTAYAKLYDAIVTGDHRLAVEVTKAALEANVDPSELIANYMIPAMNEVGNRFACNEYFVPELLIAARAMKASLELITPRLAETGAKRVGRVVIGTVKGDLHDIGKNLVASMLEGAGFEVIDLGVDVPAEKFVQAIENKAGTIVAMSALLTTTMLNMKSVIEALQHSGLRDKVRVMVGGAPITSQFAEQIGADGYGENASVAVEVARKLAAELAQVIAP